MALLDTRDQMLQSLRGQSVISQVQVRDQAHRMSEQVAQLFGTFATDLDLVLVAVVVGQIKRGQRWMRDDGPKKLDSALGLDVVAAEAEMD